MDTTENSRSDSRNRRWIIAIFLVAAAIRLIDVWRPIDGTIREAWREADTGAIARNFYREGMNIFQPRIDWRGDGPGNVEAEFPLYPWLVACLYHVFGYHEEILRVVSYLISLACCTMFLRLAGRLLPRSAIPMAFALFAISPIPVRLASAVQPEPLMFLMYLVGIDAFIRWTDDGNPRHYVVALVATMLAILAKVTAAHVGLLYACLCLHRFGSSALKRVDVWAFAIISLGVPLAWYWQAHQIWLEYGNSLGISNEAYVRISSGSFISSLMETVPGVLSIQSMQIWMGLGLFAGMLGLRASRQRVSAQPLRYWVLALVAYFLVTGRTTGETWASYYHIVAVPAACMLMGLGFDAYRQRRVFTDYRTVNCCILLGGIAAYAAYVNLDSLEREGAVMLVAGAIAGAAGLSVRMKDDEVIAATGSRRGLAATVPLAACLLVTAALELRQIRNEAHPHGLVAEYQTAIEFSEHVPDGELIIASGPSERDQHGLLRAANPSYYFFWMDRKGFTLHEDEQSLEQLMELRERGARYYIAERSNLTSLPNLERQLRAAFPTLNETDQAVLFDLGGNVVPSNIGEVDALSTLQAAARP